MHSLADVVVATERERQVAHATTDMGTRQVLAYPCCRTDEVGSIAVVLLHTCSNSQYIWIKDNV